MCNLALRILSFTTILPSHLLKGRHIPSDHRTIVRASLTFIRMYFLRLAEDKGFHIEVLAELKYDIPKTFKHQKMKSKDVFVDLYRFTHKS
jgi:predicted RNA methylase